MAVFELTVVVALVDFAVGLVFIDSFEVLVALRLSVTVCLGEELFDSSVLGLSRRLSLRLTGAFGLVLAFGAVGFDELVEGLVEEGAVEATGCLSGFGGQLAGGFDLH